MSDGRGTWFIYSPRKEDWAGLRMATFSKFTADSPDLITIIHNEMPDRIGPRIWADIVEREGWVKVMRIDTPTPAMIMAAMREAGL